MWSVIKYDMCEMKWVCKSVFLLIMLFSSTNGLAVAQSATSVSQSTCASELVVAVKGLVCDFCARALEKVFTKREEVAQIDVDLQQGRVLIRLHADRQLAADVLQQLMTDSGYSIATVEKRCAV